MPDMFDCGRYVHESWKRGVEYQTRWLGPYDPSMPMEEIHARLEHHKITAEGRAMFERGFNSLREEAICQNEFE